MERFLANMRLSSSHSALRFSNMIGDSWMLKIREFLDGNWKLLMFQNFLYRKYYFSDYKVTLDDKWKFTINDNNYRNPLRKFFGYKLVLHKNKTNFYPVLKQSTHIKAFSQA